MNDESRNGQSLQQRIADLAYSIWEADGWPSGQAARHWAMAEKLVQAQDEARARHENGE